MTNIWNCKYTNSIADKVLEILKRGIDTYCMFTPFVYTVLYQPYISNDKQEIDRQSELQNSDMEKQVEGDQIEDGKTTWTVKHQYELKMMTYLWKMS